MKSNTNPANAAEAFHALRTDCKRWRRLASQYAEADAYISATQEEQYKVLHSHILATCRGLAGQEAMPPSQRQASLEMEELLRPWASARNFRDAQAHLVEKLIESQLKLERQLRGEKQSWVWGRYGKVAKPAGIAAVAGIAVFLFLEWGSDDATELLSSIAAYLGRTSFTEQFAVAVLFSWLFGTWLLSRLSSS
jgi:hypothetical protein